jgi:polyhydroxybutyrate depolymerase
MEDINHKILTKNNKILSNDKFSYGITPVIIAVSALLLTSAPVRDAEARVTSTCTVRYTTVGGLERNYKVCVPSVIIVPTPVVFAFHGGGGNAENARKRTHWDAVGKTKGFISVFPNGCEEDRCDGGSWNAGDWGAQQDIDDRGLIAAILADLSEEFTIDSNAIYADGQSAGGMMAYSLACDMSATFAAIGAEASAMTDASCSPSGGVSVFHVHGSDDDLVPWDGSGIWPAPMTGIDYWREVNGCSGDSTVSFDDGVTMCREAVGCQSGKTVEWCYVNGATHNYRDLEASFDISNWLWDKFTTYSK